MTDLATTLDDLCARYTRRPAVISLSDQVITFADVQAHRDKIRTACAAAGLTSSHRVATILPDAADTALTLLGLVTEVSVLPINSALLPSEIIDLLSRANVDAVISDPSNPLASEVATSLNLPLLDASDPPGWTPCPPTQGTRRPGLVLLTSGSTGTPKMVPITPDAMLASAQNIAATLALGPDDRALHALPMFHIGAVVDLLLAPLLNGGATVICPDRTPTALADAIAQGGATWLQLVPTMLLRCLAEFDDNTLRKMGEPLRFVRSVSADLSAEVQACAERTMGIPLIQMYGMTETAGQITSNPVDGPGKPTSVGPAAGPQIAILDATGNRCAAGQDGEVCAKGPTVFNGYEGTAAPDTFFGDWFRTGDIGHLDADGYLFLTGRKKEMINQGGEKISPLEIERAALATPGVQDAAAYPLPHPTLGDQPGLTVVGDVTEDAVLAHLATQLANYKCPRNVRIVEALPRLGAGKVDKRALMQMEDGVATTAVTWKGRDLAIATLWSTTLQTDLPAPETDFFDAGGDSLAATTFILELEKLTGAPVDPNLLFNAPTFGAMLDALAVVPAQAKTEAPILTYVRQMMAGWPGTPMVAGGITRSLGTASTGQPIFWCGTAGEDGEILQQALGHAHPIHAIMSTSQFKGRQESDERTLAQAFVDEIQQIAPSGPLVVGGFCNGGRVMRYATDLLQAAGRHIRCFVAVDYWFTQPTDYPVFHIFSHDRLYSGSAYYHDHALALPLLHPEGVATLQMERGHGMDVPSLSDLPAQLEPLLDGTKVLAPLPSPPIAFADRPQLYHATLRASPPRFVRPGAAWSFTATVSNQSDHAWGPTADSGFCVVAHAINFDGIIRKRNVAVARLETALAPKESRTLTMSGTYPDTKMPIRLQINMSDQGICDWDKASGGRVMRVVWPKLLGR